jgi:hypothetical protein
MENRTYSRFRKIVSMWNRAQAVIEEVCAFRNCCHDWFSRCGAGSVPAFFRDLPYRRWCQPVAEADEFAVDTPIPPAVVLPGHPYDQRAQPGGL